MNEEISTPNQHHHQTEHDVKIIKTKFTSAHLGLYGLVIMVVNKNEQEETINGIITTHAYIHDTDLDASWKRFQDLISSLKVKRHFNNSLSNELVTKLKEMFTDYNISAELYDAVEYLDYTKLNTILGDVINKVLNEKNSTLESLIQSFSQEEHATNADASDDQNAPSAKPSATVLTVIPILSPLKGKPVYELKVGDKIMVKIIPSMDQMRYIELFDVKKDNEVMPIPAEIVDIKAGRTRKSPTEVTTKLSKEIYGYFVEDESHVRLKMYDPNDDYLYHEKVESKSHSILLPIILIFIAIFLLIFVIIQIT